MSEKKAQKTVSKPIMSFFLVLIIIIVVVLIFKLPQEDLLEEELPGPCDAFGGKEFTKCSAENLCETDECVYDAAIELRKENICFDISDDNLRVQCTTSISTSNLIRDVVENDNIELCNGFDSESMVKYCQDNYYLSKAINGQDLSFCDKIETEVIKNECLR